MKSISVPAALLSLVLLAGCSAAGIDRPTVADDTAGVPIVDSVPANGRVISDINIELCQATAGDKAHTVEEAMKALKMVGSTEGR